MATELVPYKWDDLHLATDGTKKPAAGTLKFSVNGSGDREIDVSAEHLSAFEAFMRPFIDASRPAPASRPTPAVKKHAVSSGRPRENYLTNLREWAAERDIEVPLYYNAQGGIGGYRYLKHIRAQFNEYLRVNGRGDEIPERDKKAG